MKKPVLRQRKLSDLRPGVVFLFWRINSRPIYAVAGLPINSHRRLVEVGRNTPVAKKFGMAVDQMVWVEVGGKS